MLAAGSGHQMTTETLITLGADVNAIGNGGVTALIIAVEKKQIKTARTLLDSGAEINARSKTGVSALIIASKRGALKMAEMLIAHGAEIDIADNNGETPIVVALKGKYIDPKAFFLTRWYQYASNRANSKHRIEVIKLLIEKGSDLSAKDKLAWEKIDTTVNKRASALIFQAMATGKK
jgi:ankyrin repeat protein